MHLFWLQAKLIACLNSLTAAITLHIQVLGHVTTPCPDQQHASWTAVHLRREKELAAVKINKDDVDVIVAEIEVDKKLAERRLRECNGNLVDALKSFL